MSAHHDFPPALERRNFLRIAGTLGLGSLIVRSIDAGPVTPLGAVWSAASCTLTPAGQEGPFYLPLDLMRSDITDGRPGFGLDLYLKVVRASDCLPIAGAVLDVWHASAFGRYSGFASEGTSGQTFMRGIQITPTNGIVHFHTVFPGWYLGRATHLHLKVRPTPSTVLTTQLYFPESIQETLAGEPIYTARGPNPMSNRNDPTYTPCTLVPVRALGKRGLLAPLAGPQSLLGGFTIAIA